MGTGGKKEKRNPEGVAMSLIARREKREKKRPKRKGGEKRKNAGGTCLYLI